MALCTVSEAAEANLRRKSILGISAESVAIQRARS